MSTEEAKGYVDAIVDQLVDWKIISAYGRMSDRQRQELADKLVAMSEEGRRSP